MKKIFFLILFFSVLSCNDGNQDIASFEFEETVYICKTDVFTLYRLSENGHREALIVTLTDQQIKDSEEPVLPVAVTPNGPVTVTDRIFNEEVTNDYFCSVVPPITPKVVKNWEGISGIIEVNNEAVYDEEDPELIVAYKHNVILHDVVLENGDETLIFNVSYSFGSFETAVEF